MKKLVPLYALLVMALVSFFLWSARLWPFDGHAEPLVVSWEELSVEHDAVRVKGTAHYPVRVSQEREARFGHTGGTWYIFPLFPHGDTMGRKIKVIVATPVPIDDLASFEDMTVDGWALPAAAAMTPASENLFRDSGYSFEENYFVIEAFSPEEGE